MIGKTIIFRWRLDFVNPTFPDQFITGVSETQKIMQRGRYMQREKRERDISMQFGEEASSGRYA